MRSRAGEGVQVPTVAKDAGSSFSLCEHCGHVSGFDVSFAQADGAHDVVLICPSCGQRHTSNGKV